MPRAGTMGAGSTCSSGGVPMDAWTTNTVQAADRVSAFLWKVYGWMAIGLGLTALVAFAVAGSPDLLRVLIGNRLVFFALIIAELGLVFFMSARADRLAPGTAAGLFALYSALNGVTLSAILLVYTGESVTMTFVVTAGMFGALALFGSTTKRSLAGAGQFFMMGLVGLILASLVGMFWHNDALQFLISVVGVIQWPRVSSRSWTATSTSTSRTTSGSSTSSLGSRTGRPASRRSTGRTPT